MSVPKLRFKEFDGDWSETSIGKLTKYFKGYAFKSESYKESGRRIIRVSDFGRDSIKYDNDAIFLDEVESLNYKDWMLKKDDIVITTVGSKPHLIDSAVGRPIYIRNNEEGLLNQNLLVLRPINQEVEPYFIFSQLLDNKYLTHIETIQRGNANQSNITVKDLQEFKFFSTSKTEQTKIASFLSAVDEKISQLTQKHELLSQYKQGMMQKLFSQQIRFKADDGSEFGEWEETNFSSQFNFHNTNSHSRALLAEYGEIMNIHYGDIHTKFSMLFDVTKENIPFLNVEVDTSKITNEQFLKVGDLVIADASEDYKDIGKAIEVIKLNNQKVVAGLHTYIARPVKPFALGFCGYMMQTFEVREQIKKLATGISVLGISKTNLGKVELRIPCFEEQTKIANFLSAIEQKIDMVVQQIEQAKQWKKGLLQQMFV
ncbi:restriction endonuclease subunit S [Acinetobacter genomosp. 15BJ]|uniref:Restriction endonuclease subunit S n=1 Tax=Acinetobacter genomosp. 15BJ TaxID=106651 RepID=A0ABT8V432_9GAMM|nr:restriction endonuclease subunit S [Acinetobacter genomosp. 15BJ]MDO3658936.1 restriction endonuclease subunit S [Acinetobacter genomosp. 15BJ]